MFPKYFFVATALAAQTAAQNLLTEQLKEC